MTHAIRVDEEVRAELLRRRLPGETNHNGAIVRAIDEAHLEAKLGRHGLTTDEMAELTYLRALREVPS